MHDITRRITVEVIISPPAIYLLPLADAVKGSNIKVAAQNSYLKESGAYTGEIRCVLLVNVRKVNLC